MFAIQVIAAAAVLRLPARPTADGPLVVGAHRTVELVNLGGPTAEALLHRIGANVGAAVDAVEAFWGTDWTHHITVVATGSDQEFAARAGGGASPGQWSDIAAVAVADRVDSHRRLAAGQRIVFAPGASAMSTASLRIVLTHELFHYAARADTAFDAPRWLTEGIADFVARGAPTPADYAGLRPELPSDTDLDAPGSSRAQAYDRSWWLSSFIAQNYGTEKLRLFYLAACGPGRSDLATAAQRVLGTGLTAVVGHWQRSVTG